MEEKAYGGGAFDAACAVTVSGRLWKCGTCCAEKRNQGNDFGSIQYLPAGYAAVPGWFNKKYPGIEVKYQSYSDYDNEVSKQIQSGCCVYDGESSL